MDEEHVCIESACGRTPAHGWMQSTAFSEDTPCGLFRGHTLWPIQRTHLVAFSEDTPCGLHTLWPAHLVAKHCLFRGHTLWPALNHMSVPPTVQRTHPRRAPPGTASQCSCPAPRTPRRQGHGSCPASTSSRSLPGTQWPGCSLARTRPACACAQCAEGAVGPGGQMGGLTCVWLVQEKRVGSIACGVLEKKLTM